MNPSEVCLQSSRSLLADNRLEDQGLFPVDGSFHNRVEIGAGNSVSLKSQAPGESIQEGARRKIEMAVAYMLQHLNESLEMAAVSRWTGISPSTFYYLFKRATGYTPNDFFIRARMRRACELLCKTDLNVKEVASLLGYPDQFYFSRLFKAITGLAPRAYRTRRHQLQDSRLENSSIVQGNSASFRLNSNQEGERVQVLEKNSLNS